jgi:hypothetical protein
MVLSQSTEHRVFGCVASSSSNRINRSDGGVDHHGDLFLDEFTGAI